MLSFLNGNDRLLLGSRLRRRRNAIILATILLAVVSFAVVVLTMLFSGMGRNSARVFLLSLIAASYCSLVPLAVLWWLDRRERESLWLYAAAFLWGGLIATTLALPVNNFILDAVGQWVAKNSWVRAELGPDAALLLGAPISGPIVEEITKGAGVLLLFFLMRAEFDNMRDGFIYGAIVGAGFNWLETPLYVAQGYAQAGDAPWELQLGARFALFGLSGHAMFSGLFGAFLGFARQTRHWAVRWIAPVIGLMLAMLAHSANNLLPLIATLAQKSGGKTPLPSAASPPEISIVEAWASASLMDLIFFFPFVALVLLLLWRSGRWELNVIREELAEESRDLVTTEEYQAIMREGLFQTRRIDKMDKKRSSALINAQHELAFRKRRVRDDANDPDADALVAGWREEIRRLRAGSA